MKLNPFQCDINTAYLNAKLKIVHFIKKTAGFPLKKGYDTRRITSLQTSTQNMASKTKTDCTTIEESR
ncbi:Copiatype Polyprotein [Phytophthora palmivora]|uniref:Copiatype Polyprotein n=1 Tax=Phytophthora palmivora TaxID=4796 RepID=A0A2P4YVL8_9STRA|nr:Copiatype Polyprotein [Phytophthora palmivora]